MTSAGFSFWFCPTNSGSHQMDLLLTKLVVSFTGYTSRSVFKLGLCSIEVGGLDNLLNALDAGRGVITVSNHISTLDDPVAWSILPTSHYAEPRKKVRWSLGASDVMFTNPYGLSFLFKNFETKTERS